MGRHIIRKRIFREGILVKPIKVVNSTIVVGDSNYAFAESRVALPSIHVDGFLYPFLNSYVFTDKNAMPLFGIMIGEQSSPTLMDCHYNSAHDLHTFYPRFSHGIQFGVGVVSDTSPLAIELLGAARQAHDHWSENRCWSQPCITSSLVELFGQSYILSRENTDIIARDEQGKLAFVITRYGSEYAFCSAFEVGDKITVGFDLLERDEIKIGVIHILDLHLRNLAERLYQSDFKFPGSTL